MRLLACWTDHSLQDTHIYILVHTVQGPGGLIHPGQSRRNNNI